MEEKKIIIDQEFCNYVESVQYDTEALKQVMTQLNPINTPPEILDYWKNSYLDKFKEYTLAKQSIENLIRESAVIDNSQPFSWSLDFSTREVTIVQ